MKKFKKLIPALCMLLISAVLMGTSTYAWFSMNKTVTAEGMSVTAQTNNYYLLIGNTETVATIQTNKKTTETATKVTTSNTDNKVYPAMYGDGSKLGDELITEVGKWYTANNTNIGNATDAITNARVLENSELGSYVIEYNMWLTLAKGSTAVDKKITVTFKRGDTVDSSISAVVVIGSTNAIVFDHTKVATGEGTTTHPTAETSANVSLTDAEAVKVTVYVYVDGNATNVNTAYLNGGNTLTGNIELLFTVND